MSIGLFRIAKSAVARVYALAVLLLVVWTGYTAVDYLFHAVFRPARLPASFLDWQGHLDADALRGGEEAGVTGPAGRAPMSHYHGVDRWFEPDPHNGCTTSGCHSPLPHNRSKELRAFANLHATFLACEMCHDPGLVGTVPATWIATATGEPQPPPATLELMRRLQLEAEQLRLRPAELQEGILALLRQVVELTRQDPLLSYLQVELETAQPGSPVWRQAIEQLRDELPAHARGEYGAKLALRVPDAERREAAQRMAELTREYLDAPEDGDERDRISEEIHVRVATEPAACLPCHGGEPPRLDFESLGYSPARSTELHRSLIARFMPGIEKGEEFPLPNLLEGRDAE